MTSRRDMDLRSGLMELGMRERSRMARKRGKEYSNLQMVVYSKVRLQITRLMVRDLTFGETVRSMWASGFQTKCMAKGS